MVTDTLGAMIGLLGIGVLVGPFAIAVYMIYKDK
jgi:hypothetical protein